MSASSRKSSQRDIARLAEVSQTAVSLVLNGKATEHNIPGSTQQRIQRAMDELDYVPNPAARSLRGGRNNMIGVHTYERVFPVEPNDYFHEFLVGIEEKAVELGQDLVLFASTQRADGTRSIYGAGGNRLRLADGAVILGLERDDDEIRRLSRESYPFVMIGRREIPGASFAYIGVDYLSAVASIVIELADLGHGRALYVRGPEGELPQRERRAAFEAQAALNGVDVDFVDETSELLTPEGLQRLCIDGVTVVVTEAHGAATTVAVNARVGNLAIPADLSAICLDVLPPDSPARRWSHLSIPRRAIGARAVELLSEILDNSVPADYHESYPCVIGRRRATIASPP